MTEVGEQDPRRDEESEARDSRRGPLIAVIILVVLVVGAVWTVSAMRKASAIQDCVMQGRRNCAPVSGGPG
jgi:hypothetical protein